MAQRGSRLNVGNTHDCTNCGYARFDQSCQEIRAPTRSVNMKATRAAIFVLSLSLTLAAQSHENAPTTTPSHVDLTAMLKDADGVVSTTNTDLANLHVEKWSSGWKTAWTKKSSHKQQAGQTADSVKTLASGLTPIIADARSSHGNVGSTFKLYNSLTLVCENMDALVEATHSYGKKEEYNRLAADYANLLRIRGTLSNYVEQRAAVVDPKGSPSMGAAVPESAAKKDGAKSAKKVVARKKKPVLRSSR
jgi:hypothetical protein